MTAGQLFDIDPGLRSRLDSCFRLRLARCLRSSLNSFKDGD